MPNWVFNYLNIEGSELDIARVKKQLNTPYTQTYKDYVTKDGKVVEIFKEATHDNPIFAFWNIIKPEDMNAYLNEESSGVPKDPNGEWFTSNNWYDWNVRNWGTKWDVAVENDEKYPETHIVIETKKSIGYRFDTAWSPPVPAIEKLSKQYPNLKFSLDYEEETGWGGEVEFTNGDINEIEKYETKCRDCDALDTLSYCDNGCGEVCSDCNNMGECDEEAVAKCDIHKEYLVKEEARG